MDHDGRTETFAPTDHILVILEAQNCARFTDVIGCAFTRFGAGVAVSFVCAMRFAKQLFLGVFTVRTGKRGTAFAGMIGTNTPWKSTSVICGALSIARKLSQGGGCKGGSNGMNGGKGKEEKQGHAGGEHWGGWVGEGVGGFGSRGCDYGKCN